MVTRWDAFAAREPYFAVLTEPRFLRARFDAAAEADFFQSGDEYVSDLYGTVLASVAQHFAPLTVLEYGCGVGRLLIPFGRRAEKVTGVDISPAMLDAARHHIERAGVRNVELLTTDQFETDGRTFDLVNCFLVFQRLRRADGLELLRKLVRRVREGGVGVFHLPYRAHVSPLVRVARETRARVPGVNAVANVLRRKPASTPLIESNTYDLNDVLAVLQEHHFDAPHLVFTRHGELDGVIVHALRKWSAAPPPPELVEEDVKPTAPQDEFIDVRKLVASTSIEALNRTAEAYFAGLETWEHHLAKPFAMPTDSPQLLINLGTVLQGLQLAPDMTVLEYGAGTGWLARYLTQLGCRMILLDVAPTALTIARELYAKQPVIGERPEPQFLVFDGRRIDLPDASVDRILCFDSFHHAPNPDEVLREFGRVLKPRGIAAFAEPGPKHSMTPQSQYEMRTYGVVEADIDIHAIWESAKRLGFVDLKLAAFHIPPFHVSLAEYDDLLASGETLGRWAEATQTFLHDARTFFLTKAGSEEADSRRAEGLRAVIDATLAPPRAGEPISIHVTVRNTGKAKWLDSNEPHGGVALGCHLHNAEGRLVDLDYGRVALPRPLDPGEEVTFDTTFPPLEAGRWMLELDCVAELVAWFAQTGSTPTRIEIEI
ncbi:MAG TPA: methyltransferase domain-containing protein [Thermoanaerobaculia bacterium]|jgi:ubiquinone/menaquinone biosynthesis C-methylase UbiE|nr:methyltransferase domain-containing protein [Thermoanaerobaculia bacterium]